MDGKKWFLELVLEGQEEEQIQDHVCFPLYCNNYEDAIRVILLRALRVAREKNQYSDSRLKNAGEEKRYGNRQLRTIREEKQYGPSLLSRLSDEEGNVIPFLGRRGSGKTTAMAEFCEILERMNQRDEYRFWLDRAIREENLRQELEREGFQFYVLDRIDVSSLESREDLFELIMSGLFRLYKENSEKYLKDRSDTDIQKKFNDIMKGYYAIRDSREEDFGDMYLPKLDYMYSSFGLRKQIEELITSLFEKVLGYEENYFLVIALDDLDLNVGHGYEMLEQLRKYFFNRHTLITLSADYEQLNCICRIHYIRDFSTGRSHVIEDIVKDNCATLAKDYIAKVMPVDSRIYMPDWKKMVRKIVVRGEEGSVSVKDYIIGKIAAKMRLFHDIDGLKKHFVEQDTVRELVKYDFFLETLLDIPYEEWKGCKRDDSSANDFMERYDQNHERYNNDVLNRLANQLLTEEKWKEFQRLNSLDLERRAERTCELFFRELDQKQDDKKSSDQQTSQHSKDLGAIMTSATGETKAEDVEEGKQLSESVEEEESRASEETSQNNAYTKEITSVKYDPENDYSYGSLLQGIYEYGRLSEENKAFIKCILASFTSEMVREKISLAKNPREGSHERSSRRLSSFLGTRVGNSWLAADMMPMLKKDGEQGIKTGFLRKEVLSNILSDNGEVDNSPAFYIDLKEEELSKIDDKNVFGKEALREELECELDSLKELMENSKLIPSLETLFFFVSVQKKEGEQNIKKFPFDVRIDLSKEIRIQGLKEKYVLWIGWKDVPVTVSIWEFIGKCVDLHGALAELHAGLSREIGRVFCEKKGVSDANYQETLGEIFLEWIREQSLFREYSVDDFEADVFPYCNLDLAYNVMKRARKELKEEERSVKSPHAIDGSDGLLDAVGNVYMKVAEYLQKEDQKYKSGTKVPTSFYQNFIGFPIVKMMTDKEYKNQMNPTAVEALENLLSGQYNKPELFMTA